MRSVSVIVCAYTMDRWDDLCSAIASVRAQSRAADQVIVVIDHNDQLLQMAKAQLGGVLVVANTLSKGLSGARNSGVAAAHGEVLAFLDDDASAHRDWLRYLLEPFEDPSVLATGGEVRPSWEGNPPVWFPEEFLWVVGCSYRGLPGQTAEVRNPIGASMAIRRQVFAEVGGFTDGLGRIGRYPLGCEETELCIRVRQRWPGSRAVYEPRAIVDHRVPSNRTSWSYFVRRCYAEGLSKAAVTRLVGADHGLSSERSYASRTLPSGAAHAARMAIRHRDRQLARRSLSIPAGLAVTSVGFVAGRLARTTTWPGVTAPIYAGELELDAPAWPLPRTAPNGRLYKAARLLVRSSGEPVGTVEIAGPDWPPVEDVLATAKESCSERFARLNASPERRPGIDVASIEALSRLPPATVVVPTRNRPSAVDACLASLASLAYPSYRVLVVDNGSSTEETREVVDRWSSAHPFITYLSEPVAGSSRARNMGLARTDTPIVAFTDDDVEVDALWLRRLVEALQSADDVVCATGLVWPASLDTAPEQWFEQYGGFNKGYDCRLWDMSQHRGTGRLYPYTAGMFGSGNNVAFDTAFLRRAGGYDEALGPGTVARAGEDLDLFLAAIIGGHQIAYTPSAVVCHHHRNDAEQLLEQIEGYGVGIAGVITKWALRDPKHLVEILRRIPIGISTVLNPVSPKNAAKAPSYPRRLDRAEVRGMLRGPLAYVQSRARRTRMNVGAP